MAFGHGKDSRVLMGDLNMSTELSGWQASWKIDLADSTALSDSGFRGNRGLTDGSLSFEGFLNNAALVANKPLYNKITTQGPGVDDGLRATIWPMGGAIGNPAIFAALDTSDFSVDAANDDNVKIKVEGKADVGVDMGFSQADLTLQTSSQNHASVDNLVATNNGGAAMLHVTGITSGTSLIVKIQHSTDNSSWADLITFTTVTTVAGSELKTVAAGTTVNRYTRATSTIVGTNYTYGVSFARR